MPVTKSAKKALRQSVERHARNTRGKALYKEVAKKFEGALASGDAAAASKLLPSVYGAVDTLAKKNVIPPNNASRKKAKAAADLKKVALSK